MEIKLSEIQAIIDELKKDSQTMANEQVRTTVEQLDEIFGELELKQTLLPTPDQGLESSVIIEQIEKLMSSILLIFESVPKKEELLLSLLQAATIFRRMGENESVIKYCEHILNLTEAGGYPQIRAEALRQLGHLQFYQGMWNQAEHHYQQSLALFEAENDLGQVASIYNSLGYIAFQQGDYELAKNYHQRAIAIGEQNGYKRIIAGAYNSLGIMASVQADWDATIDYFEKSINLYKELDLPQEAAGVYKNLAMAYVDAEEWEVAGECYAEATEMAERFGNLLLLSEIYINRAEFLLNIASIDAAQLYCDKALALFQRSNDTIGIAEAYKLYGRTHRRSQNWDAAIESFTQSIQRYQACQNPQGEAEGCYEFGLMYKDYQNRSQARYFLQRARSLYEQLSAANEIKRVEAALADLDV